MMTDLQVKYQTLQHEKDKLAEEKRVHDAQIAMYGAQAGKYTAETGKVAHEAAVLDAQVQKYLAEAQLTQKDIEWYDTKAYFDLMESVSRQVKNYESGAGDILKGIGSIIPG